MSVRLFEGVAVIGDIARALVRTPVPMAAAAVGTLASKYHLDSQSSFMYEINCSS